MPAQPTKQQNNGSYKGMGPFDTIRLKILALVAASIMCQLCADDQPEMFTLNQAFEAQETELITLELENDPGHINVQVLEITDSRCPSDVVCVRFGEAIVKVGVNGMEEILKTLDLCIGDCPSLSDTVAVEIDGTDYAVILKDVIPYPVSTENPVKEAVLEVIPL